MKWSPTSMRFLSYRRPMRTNVVHLKYFYNAQAWHGRPARVGPRPGWPCHSKVAAMLVVLLGGLLLAALPAFSQTRAERRMEIRQPRRMGARQAQRIQRAQPAGFFARLRDLPPKEQERILKNDKRFRGLPSERQQKIRENLDHWNQLSPEQKEQVRRREEIYSQLTPEQRQNVREMSGEWRDLRPAERARVRMVLRRMRGMSPEQREQFLASPQFRESFSPEEQKIVRGLGQLFPDADASGR
ncbi:MAG: DUF3106 domain-containing protein [Acidobacteria bacterium]|nr:MAG: DUF3106 domain-containing protein [Acidobacteriota bacterium]